MSTFVVFTYQFSPIIDDAPSLFKDEVDPAQSMEQKNQLFESVITNDNLVISYRNSQFKRRIVLNQEGICLFRLANHKYIRVEEDFQSNKIDNHPSILVIVDNRDDKQRILIEERTGAFYDEEYVARILQNSFGNVLRKHKLYISIKKEYQSVEFWDLVSTYDKGIEKIRFAFPYPNLSRIKDSLKNLISDINSTTNSKDTKVELNAAPGESLQLDHNNENLTGLVEASAGSGQGIIIKAKGIRHQQVIGNSRKTVTIDEIEGQFPEMAMAKVIEELNKIN